jgi:hypothetical protein
MQLYIPKKVPKCPEFSDCIYPYIILLAAFMAEKKKVKKRIWEKSQKVQPFLIQLRKKL